MTFSELVERLFGAILRSSIKLHVAHAIFAGRVSKTLYQFLARAPFKMLFWWLILKSDQ